LIEIRHILVKNVDKDSSVAKLMILNSENFAVLTLLSVNVLTIKAMFYPFFHTFVYLGVVAVAAAI
jgi:hypothetical protein